MAKLRLYWPALAGALVGWAAWGYGFTPLAALFFLLWGAARNRKVAYLTALAYYLAGSRVIPGAAAVFFGAGTSLALGIGLWLVEHDPTVCTVEISVTTTVDLDIGVEFFQYDTIDHEEIGMGSDEITRREEIDIDLFLMCQGDLLGTSVDDWNVAFNIEGRNYRVKVGEVNPDYGGYEE